MSANQILSLESGRLLPAFCPYIDQGEVKVVPKNAVKAYRGVVVHLHAFITSALDGGKRSSSRPGHFIPSTL